MKMESPDFKVDDVLGFLDETRERDRRQLIERLMAASARVAELGNRIVDSTAAPSDDWTPPELLAHIAVLCKFWGLVTYKVASGEMTEISLVDSVRQRDPAAQALLGKRPGELVQRARADLARTIEFLESITASQMQRECNLVEGFSLRAEEFARLALACHLELHLEQLESALRRN